MLYGDVFQQLEAQGVEYVVAGGVAVVLHGYMRFTADLDLMVRLEENNLDRLHGALSQLGYRTRVPVTKQQLMSAEAREVWKRDKGMVVLSFFHPDEPFKNIDIFIDEVLPFDNVYQQRIEIASAGVTVPVVSIAHLKTLKTIAGRDKDLMDLRQLEEIERLDANDV